MKKILFFLLAVLCFSASAQELKLTPNGFINAEDSSKDYVVIDFPERTKEDLFKSTKLYLNTLYNNPDFVSSEVENEQIVINAVGSSGAASYHYQIIFSFKDFRVKIAPTFKYLGYTSFNGQYGKTYLQAPTNSIFKMNGKVRREKTKISVENATNQYIENYKNAILNPDASNW